MTRRVKEILTKWPLSCIIGFLLVILSWASMSIAIILAPRTFNPFKNYMSSLGNSSFNPDGAFFYNVSVIVSGFLFTLFFLGLSMWYTDIIIDKNILRMTQMFGCLLAFTIILTGIFSEDFKPQHIFWSIIAGILGFVVNVLLAIFLIRQKEAIRKISYSILILIGFYVIFLFILSPTHVLTEWIVRTLGDINLILITYNLKKIYSIRIYLFS
ncbi:MAG: DUF998 domain-containing protein [Promethearchaeota archaeon]